MALGYDPAAGPEGPLEQRLAPGSSLHQELVGRLTARLDLSRRHISKRYDDWTRTDEHVRLFLDLSRRARKGDRTADPDKREMPFERSVCIPVTAAILLVRLTQLIAIFTSRSPMIQLEGRAPEDVRPAKLMEALMAYDLTQMRDVLVFWALCQDADKYGLGVLYDTWEEESGYRLMTANVPPVLRPVLKMLGLLPGPQKAWGVLRAYNRWLPVDPFSYWPDPRVPMSQVQRGEFVGHREYQGLMYLKERERQPDGTGLYFNLDELGKLGAGGGSRVTSGAAAATGDQGRARFAAEHFSLRQSPDEADKGFYAIDHLQVKLIPRAWKLGEQDRPEIWWFTLAEEQLIIRAHGCSYAHGEFTYAAAEAHPDEHALFNPGMEENLDGLQRTIDWLVNSHIENTRKFINDSLLYSPALIEEADLLNPGPAKHIRTTQKADEMILNGQLQLAQCLYQFPFVDVTAPHLKTANVLFDFAQRLASISDPQMSQTTDDKRTLGEVQQVVAASSQRLAMLARLIDCMAIRPLAQRMVTNRQQFTTEPQFVRITGELAQEFGGAERILVAPEDLGGSFDYIAHTGVLPPDPERMAGVWMQLFSALTKAPLLLQPTPDGKQLDVYEVFNEGARAMGIKDIEKFYKPMMPTAPAVLPDAALAAGVQAGNVVPAAALGPNGRVPGAGIQGPIVPGADIR
jgi:hypothetical protein